MSKKNKRCCRNIPNPNAPMRGEIWYIEDKDKKHDADAKNRSFENSLQGGTRYCIIVSNNTGNRYSPVVEVVYTTTKKKQNLPTHFSTYSTPKQSTVLCEQIMTVSKSDLLRYYGKLSPEEISELDECLRVSLGL